MGLPKDVAAFMAKYGVTADELWEVRRGGAYAIKHAALERVAVEQNIITTFDIKALDQGQGFAAVIAKAQHGDRSYTTTGEASPQNNKNGYCLAMAEKRGIDRAILKALRVHGSIYSEEEADDFRPRPNPHVVNPEDYAELTPEQMAAQPKMEEGTPNKKMTVAQARGEYSRLQSAMEATQTDEALDAWWVENRDEVASLPGKWPRAFLDRCAAHRHHLTKEA